ncbi:21_t:CDS:2, partial [Entrophospora sp. SA101]
MEQPGEPMERIKMLPSSKLKINRANYELFRLHNERVSAIHQLQTNGVLFVGEVTSSAEKGNVFKNCNDLTRVGIFMKDCIDSAVDKGADVKVL